MSASGLETLPIGSIGIATAEALRAVRLLVAPTPTVRSNVIPKMDPRTDNTAGAFVDRVSLAQLNIWRGDSGECTRAEETDFRARA
jgi:hypothetical protein